MSLGVGVRTGPGSLVPGHQAQGSFLPGAFSLGEDSKPVPGTEEGQPGLPLQEMK